MTNETNDLVPTQSEQPVKEPTIQDLIQQFGPLPEYFGGKVVVPNLRILYHDKAAARAALVYNSNPDIPEPFASRSAVEYALVGPGSKTVARREKEYKMIQGNERIDEIDIRFWEGNLEVVFEFLYPTSIDLFEGRIQTHNPLPIFHDSFASVLAGLEVTHRGDPPGDFQGVKGSIAVSNRDEVISTSQKRKRKQVGRNLDLKIDVGNPPRLTIRTSNALNKRTTIDLKPEELTELPTVQDVSVVLHELERGYRLDQLDTASGQPLVELVVPKPPIPHARISDLIAGEGFDWTTLYEELPFSVNMQLPALPKPTPRKLPSFGKPE